MARMIQRMERNEMKWNEMWKTKQQEANPEFTSSTDKSVVKNKKFFFQEKKLYP